MIIDTDKTIIQKTKGRFISLMILVVVICALLFIPTRKDLIPGLNNNLLAIFFAAAYIVYSIYESFRNYNYVYFNDESDKIVMKYFSPTFFNSKKNSIEIPKKDFAGYTLNSFFMLYRETIVLYKNTPKGIARYPKVSITILNNEERYALLFTLNALKKQNEPKK